VREGQLLLGERIHSHGTGTWSPPGGHLEYGESPKECAIRELREETGLIATEVVPGPWTNDFFEAEGKHYISVFMFVKGFEGVPQVTEPEKCARWCWFDFDALPQPLFLPLHNLLKESSLALKV
jgi:8-oxo-dGTP diphosphatase